MSLPIREWKVHFGGLVAMIGYALAGAAARGCTPTS
jgi:hypothetical protein